MENKDLDEMLQRDWGSGLVLMSEESVRIFLNWYPKKSYVIGLNLTLQSLYTSLHFLLAGLVTCTYLLLHKHFDHFEWAKPPIPKQNWMTGLFNQLRKHIHWQQKYNDLPITNEVYVLSLIQNPNNQISAREIMFFKS